MYRVHFVNIYLSSRTKDKMQHQYEDVVLNLVGQKPQYNTNIEIFFLYSAGQKPQIRTNMEMSSYIQQDKRQNKQIGDVVLYP